MSRPLALIAGGTSGIGLAVARRLQRDYRLALLYASNHERARTAQAQLCDEGAEVVVKAIDVTRVDQVEAGYAQLLELLGEAPEVLINSAGIARFQTFFIQSRGLELLEEMMATNYLGAVRLVQKVLPSMYRRRRGSIVNLCSVSGLGGNVGVIGYGESKAALRCFTQNLAQEVAHRGISVNSVSPGRVATPMTEEFLQRFKPESINYPLGRCLTPDEVAQAVEFLVRLGPAVNGQDLVIDGGTSLARVRLEPR